MEENYVEDDKEASRAICKSFINFLGVRKSRH